jgi:hypothetical protein
MKEEKKIFCIKIMDREALLVPGKTVAFSMLREPIEYLVWVVFCDFFDIFPICKEWEKL